MKRMIAKSVLALACGAGVFAVPATAKADHFDRFHVEFRGGENYRRHEVRRIWIEPVYEERNVQVWAEPVYRTECTKVLIEPERYETRCDRVWVEPVFEVRDVVRYEHGRRYCRRERVCVREGYWQTVEHRVLIPAVYRNDERQVLVTPGHYETRCDRVCVREGHWDTVETARPYERFSFGLGFGGRF